MYLIAIVFPNSSPPLVLQKNVQHLMERQGTFFMLILGKSRVKRVEKKSRVEWSRVRDPER